VTPVSSQTVGPSRILTLANVVPAERCRAWFDRAWAAPERWKTRFEYIKSYGVAWYLEIEYGMLHAYHAQAAKTNGMLAELDGLVPALASTSKFMEAPDGRTGLPARARSATMPYWVDAGVVAMTSGKAGYIHADFEGLSPYPEMLFDPATRAYSAVLMLAKPKSGGDLKFWAKRHLGNEMQNLEGAPSEVVSYEVGSVQLFDSFCYHQILDSELTPEHPVRAVAAMHFVYRATPEPHFEYWY
jgi:hypothetical protein